MSMNPNITMPDARGQSDLINAQGMTSDIIDAVVSVGKESAYQCARLAPQFQAVGIQQTARKLHAFIREHIRYIEDPPGKQWIKTPARTWSDKIADCKGYSIFTHSVLTCLGIPHAYRFVSYRQGAKVPQHVYIVAFDRGQEIPIDACLEQPLHELPYTFKKDIMTQISKLSGPSNYGMGFNPGVTTDAEMDLLIARERLVLEKIIAEQQISGIGSSAVQERERAIQAIEQALTVANSPRQLDQLAQGLSGIGGIRDFIKKVANTAKKGVKAVAKAVSAVPRTALKGLVEITLPKASPFFLYLFIQDAPTINRLPAVVKAKRAKSQKLARFVIGVLGMQERHFMGLVRNGIMKKFGKTPEQVLTSYMKGKANIAGIGYIEAILALINKIIQLFKKRPPAGITAKDAPDPGDFEGWGQAGADAYAQASANKAQGGMPPLNATNSQGAVIPQTSLNPPPVTDPNNAGGNGKGGLPMPLLLGAAALLFLSK